LAPKAWPSTAVRDYYYLQGQLNSGRPDREQEPDDERILSNGHQTGYTWNFTYDDRFVAGHAPPYFPYVTKFLMQVQNIEATAWGRKY
jgi:hypothetical protein